MSTKPGNTGHMGKRKVLTAPHCNSGEHHLSNCSWRAYKSTKNNRWIEWFYLSLGFAFLQGNVVMLVTGSFYDALHIWNGSFEEYLFAFMGTAKHICAGRWIDVMYSQALTTEILHSAFLSFPLIIQMLTLISRTSKLISLLFIALNIEICLFLLRLHSMFTYRWRCYLPS